MKLLGIKNFKWENYYACLGGKLLEYYLSADYIIEVIRTFLVENLKLDKKIVNKMFPYNYKDFEYTSNIIKNDELKNLKNNLQKEKETEKEKEINKKENQKDNEGFNSSQGSTEEFDDESNEENKFDSQLNKEDEYKNNENLNPHSLNRGSNNFVVSGKYTKNGKPILVNDPHLMN